MRERSLIRRFRASYVVDGNGCWVWTRVLNSRGYARICVNNKMVLAHRWIWMRWNGEIPDGLCVDHICENKRCVNPDHMQLLTPRDNILRSCPPKTRCPKGHVLDEVGYYMDSGRRRCKPCHLERTNARYHRRMANKKISVLQGADATTGS